MVFHKNLLCHACISNFVKNLCGVIDKIIIRVRRLYSDIKSAVQAAIPSANSVAVSRMAASNNMIVSSFYFGNLQGWYNVCAGRYAM